MGQQGANVIELAVVPTFGTQWLLPRLKDFQQQHPDVTVNLTNRTRPFLFADTDFDAAIYFGDADWSGTSSYRLMGENPVPVCSPRSAASRSPSRRRTRRTAAAAANHAPLRLAPVVQRPATERPPRHDRPALRTVLDAGPGRHA
jgi:DNA-binding transcriptional LysR family regulator